MAVVSVKKMSHKATSKSGRDGKSATIPYLVKLDAVPSSPIPLETATDGTITIPVMSAGHPDDSSRLVSSITPTAIDESRLTWIVTVEYQNKDATTGDYITSPLSDDPIIKWDFGASSQPYFRDSTGVSSLNTAGEPFENLLSRETGEVSATWSKNITHAAWVTLAPTIVQYAAGDGTEPDDAATAINDDTFTFDGISIETGQARFTGGSVSERQRRNGTEFRVLQITLKFRKSWVDRIDSRGFNELDGSDKLKEIIKGTPPVKVDKSWPLDTDGHALADHTDAPAVVALEPYPPRDFDVFGFA